MIDNPFRVTAAFACEDIRRESDGKIMAIGIIQPTIELTPFPGVKTIEEMQPLRLHFLLLVDFTRPGEFEVRFRLKRIGATTGVRKRALFSVKEEEKGAPVPLGPFTFKPQPGDTGFILQQLVGGKWRRIGSWKIDPPVPALKAEAE